MKVFKFYCGEIYYIFAAKTKGLAIEEFYQETGDLFNQIVEIPECEWDEKNINVWEDNDRSTTPWKESIRTLIIGEYPQFICTNDT